MGELSLREATVADAGEIARIHVDSWWATYRGLVPDAVLEANTVTERTIRWRELLRRGTETILAADATTVLGFCALRREPDLPVEIGALYLHPARFRQAIGTRLLQETITRLRTAGDPEVTLWVLEGNTGARAFYEHHGFAETGERDQWHGVPELRMALALTS